jgi:hypothetical protein
MQAGLDAMKTALRVLTAITEKREPDPADITLLRSYAGPQPKDVALDEFACTIIQQALKHRAEIRSAAASGGSE